MAGLVAALHCSIGNAQIIYSNVFSGSGLTINKTAPTFATNLLGGSSNALWVCTYTNSVLTASNGTVLANGTIGTNAGCALLPFTPQPGCIYYMTASLTVPAPMAQWVALGFAQSDPQTNNPSFSRFNDNPGPQGYGFFIPRTGVSVQLFGGPRTSLAATPTPIAMPNAGTYTLQILLNTFNPKWTVSAFVNGTIMGTNVVGGTQIGTNIVYTSNPPIGFAGIGQTSFAGDSVSGIQWNYWALSTAPLPVISQQPTSAAVSAGTAYTNTFSAVANTNGGTLYYQWYTNGVPIPGATNSNLVLNPVETNNASTNYYAVVTNSYGSATSSVVSLTVLNGPLISSNDAPVQLTSPDGSLVLTFAVTNFDGSMSCPIYNVARNGQTLITTSKLGLTFGSGLLQQYVTVLSETNNSSNSIWQPVYAEQSSITNNYNQLVANLQELVPPYRLLQLTFRAYNEGAAFCYTIPEQTNLAGATNLTEQTEFRFDADYTTWTTYTAQGVYTQTNISGVNSGCERPLTVQLATNLYTAIGEAKLVNYSRMKFAPLGESNCLISLLDGPVTNPLPLTTPWRFVMGADSPGQLMENDYFSLNLNDPCALTNTTWIQPGKVIREVTLTTAGAIACVDFAAAHNISYIEFDAGWYGPENTTLTATNAISSLNLPGIISYAASNNVGVILYVNWLAMTNELTLLPPLYQSWGVKGIKYGFVSVGPQQYTEIVNSAAPICASNQMMMEVHDEFRPSGYTRTYPNFMSIEGILGDESTPTTTQDTTSLFSRMLVGGADHTMCYFDSRVTNNWSYAYQLAKAVCFYSPWQYLYWYDRPTNSPGYVAGASDMITEVPEMEFYDYMPTVWDETKVLQSSIGQYAIIARRSGTQWFIGAMNANSNRTFNVPLDFLTAGQQYVENVYSEDPTVQTRTQVGIARSVVDSTATLTANLGASSGEAVRLLPANPPAIQSVSPLANGGFGLTITGDISLPYSLWASPALGSAGTNWTFLGSALVTNSPFQWIDVPSQTQRFYRSSTP
jgi:alpha-glucosidase